MYQALFFSLSSQRNKEAKKKITPDLRLVEIPTTLQVLKLLGLWVLKINLPSFGVAFLIFFSHFSPIFGPFQYEKYVSRNYVKDELWAAIAWQYEKKKENYFSSQPAFCT